MCLITKQKEATIITEDMVVVKFLTKKGKIFTPPYFFFAYTAGELYKTKISLDGAFIFFSNYDTDKILPKEFDDDMENYLITNDYVSVKEGFHSIRLDMVYNYERFGNAVCKCIIPAGSEVFTNEDTGLIVSNQIIVVGLYDNQLKF
jgi:hypothetical protein